VGKHVYNTENSISKLRDIPTYEEENFSYPHSQEALKVLAQKRRTVYHRGRERRGSKIERHHFSNQIALVISRLFTLP